MESVAGPLPGLCAQGPVGAGLGLGGGSSVSTVGMVRYHFILDKGPQSPFMQQWFLL